MLRNTLPKKHNILSMLHMCRETLKLSNKLTHPLRTGIFYILLRTNKLRI